MPSYFYSFFLLLPSMSSSLFHSSTFLLLNVLHHYLCYNFWIYFQESLLLLVTLMQAYNSINVQYSFGTITIVFHKGQFDLSCRNPSLGLATKARACKVAGQERSLGITFHAPRSAKECEGMNLHTPKWTPCWELESQWTPKSSECDCRGQNPLAWKKLISLESYWNVDV